jgi:hypothetical protein
MATDFDLEIKQGASFSQTFALADGSGTAMTLTGYTAASQMRLRYDATDYVSLTCAIATSTGQITISLTPTQTAALQPKTYVYDVELTSGSTVERYIEGKIVVSPEVTR